MKIISIANQKGGVGKTTTCMSLGAAFSKRGKKVLLIDLDPQGNLSDYLSYVPVAGKTTVYEMLMSAAQNTHFDYEGCIYKNEAENVDFIPASISLSNAEMALITVMSRELTFSRALKNSIFQRYDYIFVDCLPSLGTLTTNAFAASDQVIVPVQAQKFALDGLESLLNVLELVKLQINPTLTLSGIVVTMADRTNMAAAVNNELCRRYDDKLFKTFIRRSIEAPNSTAMRKSLVICKNKLGREYENLANEILEREAACAEI